MEYLYIISVLGICHDVYLVGLHVLVLGVGLEGCYYYSTRANTFTMYGRYLYNSVVHAPDVAYLLHHIHVGR